MSIESGSLCRLKNNPNVLFVVLSCIVQGNIKLGFEEPVYTIEVLKINGERSSMFLTKSTIEVVA